MVGRNNITEPKMKGKFICRNTSITAEMFHCSIYGPKLKHTTRGQCLGVKKTELSKKERALGKGRLSTAFTLGRFSLQSQ